MKNLFTASILLLTMIFTSCNNNSVTEKPTVISINSDTTKFQIDTVKMTTIKHLTSSNLYGLHCKMCHGIYGEGDGVKARHDSTICPYDLTKITKPDKEIYYVVLNGKEKMPDQYELDTTDVWIIVIYIKKFKENTKK